MARRREVFRRISAPRDGLPFMATIKNRSEEERRLFNYGLELLKEEHLYRAVTEFYRFISYYPDSPLVSPARALAGECYFLAGKWEFAEKEYRLARKALAGDDYAWLDLRIAAASFFLDDFEAVEKAAKKAVRADPVFKEAAKYLGYLSKVRQRDVRGAAYAFEDFKTSAGGGEGWALGVTSEDILDGENLPGRSPTAAAIFSAVLPGSGQAYSGKMSDGVSSFLMIGMSGAASYLCLRDDADAPGYILGALALSFYFANIYNAADAARTYNDTAVRDYYRKLRGGSFFDHLILAPDDKGGVFAALGYSF